MASPASPPTKIRFDSFELDVTSGELRKGGNRLRLQPQPFRVLLLLIERTGQVVTREEIQRCLWKDSTFVDFEHGINFSINQIRGALSDSAEKPRYVETVPRRGYRFIGTVQQPSPPKQDSTQEPTPPPREAEPIAATPARRHWPAVVALTLLAAGVAVGAYFFTRRAPILTGQDTIVLADFANTTGDPAFDGTLRQGLQVQLKQSPFLSVLSGERVRRTLALMGQPADARLTPQITRQLCLRTGSAAMIEGSIASLGSHYVLNLDAVSCLSGDSLAEEQFEVVRKEDVLKALGEATAKLRRKLGESLSTIARFDTPLEVTTPSLEALQAFSIGSKMLEQGDYAASVPFFQRALRLDPDFASAHGALAAAYSDLGENSLAAQSTQKAYELRERVSEREKLSVESAYYTNVSGDLEKARQSLELWTHTYPRDAGGPFELGNLYDNLGQYEKALAGARDALHLDPFDSLNYAFLADSYLTMNRPVEAREVVDEAQKRGLDSPPLHFTQYQLAFLDGDSAGMSRQLAWSAHKAGIEDLVLGQEADTSAYDGRLREAREYSRRAVASAKQAELKETEAEHEADIALIEALMGNKREAQEQADQALRDSAAREVEYAAALSLAMLGNSGKAQSLASDLAKRFPEDTLVQSNYLPTLGAQIALNRKGAVQAIDSLQVAVPYDLAIPPTMGSLLLNLYPIFVRGQAFLAAHRGTEAAAEFNKILEQRGAVVNEPIGALAHLGLARAYAIQGETARSRAAYLDFFARWKNADPGIPRLVEAKAEYSALQ